MIKITLNSLKLDGLIFSIYTFLVIEINMKNTFYNG